MTDAPRYCFLLPDLDQPVGGQAVLYETAVALEAEGYDVTLVHGKRWHQYPFTSAPRSITYLPALGALTPKPRLKNRLKALSKGPKAEKSTRKNDLFERQLNDVYVIPEFDYGAYQSLVSGAPSVLFAQDAAALLKAYCKDLKANGQAHSAFDRAVVTSVASRDAVKTLMSVDPLQLTLSVPTAHLDPATPKKLQIAYMPRKLKFQSDLVTQALAGRDTLQGVPIVPIVGMTNEERNQTLNESLIFLSFSNMEGFGLPPAEAMAAGCIVIGYTGVGGNEYFSEETGFVIQHHDMTGFIRKVEEVVLEWQKDPSALNALRDHAASHIALVYNADNANLALLESWETLDQEMRLLLSKS